MNRMLNAGLLAIAFTSLTACVGAPDSGADDAEPAAQEEQVGEADDALTACRAPINVNADYILNSPGCTWASVRVTNAATNHDLVNWYAGIDTVNSVYTPLFCWQGHCTGGFWTRTAISGSWYGPISVSLEGVVSVNGITITPTTCVGSGAGGGATTTILGQGSDGYPYAVVLTNTYFC